MPSTLFCNPYQSPHIGYALCSESKPLNPSPSKPPSECKGSRCPIAHMASVDLSVDLTGLSGFRVSGKTPSAQTKLLQVVPALGLLQNVDSRTDLTWFGVLRSKSLEHKLLSERCNNCADILEWNIGMPASSTTTGCYPCNASPRNGGALPFPSLENLIVFVASKLSVSLLDLVSIRYLYSWGSQWIRAVAPSLRYVAAVTASREVRQQWKCCYYLYSLHNQSNLGCKTKLQNMKGSMESKTDCPKLETSVKEPDPQLKHNPQKTDRTRQVAESEQQAKDCRAAGA